MYRTGEFDEMVSQMLHDPSFAKEYILALTQDPLDPMNVEDALRFTIRRMGLTEFSKLAQESKPNVANFLNGKRQLKEETLNKYLSVFHLKIKKVLEAA